MLANHRATSAALILALLVASAAAQSPSPAGDWTGSIEVPGAPLDVTVHLETGAGGWRGDIDIPAQDASDLPLEHIAIDASSVTFAIADVPGTPTFRGELAADGNHLAGTFTQGGQQLTFALLRHDRDTVQDATATDSLFAGFADWLDGSREPLHVPGCAVAIVKGDELLATFASGQRDADGKLPVTADTLFAIGSSTKAFTTFALATLVDEGRLQWDEPVRTWLPEFGLTDETVAAHITPRDLVTHRSGMPRHDLAWYGATFQRAEMVARLRWLPLSHGLREQFQYNNLMFLCAGHLAERITGSTWEDLVRERILAPLGMQRTNFAVGSSAADADHAEPYRRDDAADRTEHIPFRECASIGPAGSINSSVREMANWVAVHLRGGRHGDRRLLAAATVKELHRVQIPMDAHERPTNLIVDVGYALGWMVDVYRGHRRVHHGGNIDGFSAMVTLLPDDGYGFVVLTNLDGSPLPELVARNLCDRVLQLDPHDWRKDVLQMVANAQAKASRGKDGAERERHTGTTPSHPLAAFAGDYADQGYGTTSVQFDGQDLRIAFHGLKGVLEHWHYDVFRIASSADSPELVGIPVQFASDFDGEIESVRAPLDPTVAPIVFRRVADARLRDPAFLDRLAGDYDLDGTVATFGRRGNQLTVSVAGQFYVLAPRLGLIFDLEHMHGYSVRFLLSADDAVTGVRFRQPDGVFEGTRKAG